MTYRYRDKKGRFQKSGTPYIHKLFVALTMVVLAWAVAFSVAHDALAEKIYYYADEPEEQTQLIEVKGEATPELMNKIYKTAEEYGVSAELMVEVINCETAGTFDEDIQSRNYFSDGTREKSFGLSQIYVEIHDVTKEQATNPDFAINFMARKFAKGQHHLWSCFDKVSE